MTWVGIIFIWLIAPFAELGIIIALSITNSKYKARIQELERGRMSRNAFVGTYGNGAGQTAVRAERMSAEEPGLRAPDREKEWLKAEPAVEVQTSKEAWKAETMHRAQKAEESEEIHGPRKAEESEGIHGSRKEESEEMDAPRKAEKAKGMQPSYLGMFALILGVVFIVLAGLIFATTTWRILPDICKVFSVLGCAVLFFGVSYMTERRFGVHKTSNACYILGSIFLFLAVLAAAYFELLGAEFILEGRNRWKVLWVGSVVTVLSFWAGLKRFDDKIYTQACLWGVSIHLFFMAKACSFGWDGFAAVMMVYSAVLVGVREYLEACSIPDSSGQQAKGACLHAHLATAARVPYPAACRGDADCEERGFKEILSDGFGYFAPVHFWFFAALTMIRGLSAVWIMTAVWATGYSGSLPCSGWFFSFTLSGMAAMAALTVGTGVMVRRRRTENYEYLFSLAALQTIMYGAGWLTDDSVYRMALVNQALLLIQIVRYYEKERGKKLPGLFWDICEGVFVLFSIIITTVTGNDTWRFVYLLMAAADCLLYRHEESVRRQALSLSACFAAAAFWQQPFAFWPQVIRLEMSLLPVVWILWSAGRIWDQTPWILAMRNLGYVICLSLLFLDAVISGLVVDALLLEGICLGAFVWAQVKKHVWWVRLLGGMSLGVALFMTRGFWLSISWWVYLLGAGIGLVVLAGIMEKKER